MGLAGIGRQTALDSLANQLQLSQMQTGRETSLSNLQTGREMGLAGIQQQIAGSNLAGQERMAAAMQSGETGRANIAADAAKYAPGLQQKRFETILPLLQEQISGMGGAGGGGGGFAGGGGSGMGAAMQGPDMTPDPFSRQATQEQINAASAMADRATATAVRQQQGALGGRGFGSKSPLAMALEGQARGTGLAAKMDAGRNIRLENQKANAQFGLQKQGLALQRGQLGQQAGIASMNNAAQMAGIRAQQQSALLNALSGMV
jgi:hypothetical protein